jgi:thiamine-phosphate pyrophosphorylase
VSHLPRPWLCLVTDRSLVAPDARTPAAELAALERWLDEALNADLDLIQLRERDLDARALAQLARGLVERRAAGRVRLLVNDRADVALAAGADGVHLRADGPPVAPVRALSSSRWMVGRSVHTLDEIREHATADYLLFGTVFPGGSKGDAARTQGLDALARAAAASVVPLLAIGGVTPERSAAVVAAGAAGVAAIGAFLPAGRHPGALGPVRAAEAFRAAMERVGS